jgi:hypothetical protein
MMFTRASTRDPWNGGNAMNFNWRRTLNREITGSKQKDHERKEKCFICGKDGRQDPGHMGENLNC